jgi:hypothetical protein
MSQDKLTTTKNADIRQRINVFTVKRKNIMSETVKRKKITARDRIDFESLRDMSDPKKKKEKKNSISRKFVSDCEQLQKLMNLKDFRNIIRTTKHQNSNKRSNEQRKSEISKAQDINMTEIRKRAERKKTREQNLQH